MKVVGSTYLSNRGFAIEKKGNEELVETLKQELTVCPKVNPSMIGAGEPAYFPVYRENEEKLYLPKYFGLQKFGVPTKNTIKDGVDASGLVFHGSIRPEQEAPVNAFIEAAKDPKKMGGIISLVCGGGKTVCGLYIASYFKKKTLVVCHKDFLGNQWKERIAQFLPEARVGTIKQSKVDVKDKDIVIASLQSIAMRTYEESIFKDFGLVIFDEAHHLSAEVFSQCLPKTTCKRMLGLSATLKRKDGLSKVFEWYLGKPVFQLKREDNHLEVLVKRFYDPTPEYSKEIKMHWNGKLNVAKMINNVCEFPPRSYMIVDTLMEVLKKEPKRQVLILSERRNHLVELENILLQRNVTSIGYYIGGMRQEDLDKSAEKQILLGTFQLAQEGMDVPTLNTLILASPVSSIEQAIGRIQRQKREARIYKPLVIDILDEFSIFEGQGRKRIAFYTKNGYEITDPMKEKQELEKDMKYCFIEDPDDS